MGGLTLDKLALGISNCRNAENVAREIAAAESLGVRAAFIAEDVGCRDAFELAVVAARQTSSITLTIGVTNPYTRSAASLVESYLTLSEISSGRGRLGLGSSSRAIIEGQLGLSYGHPVEVMEAAIERIRVGLVQAAPARGMPLLLAAMGPRMLRLAGAVADAVLLNTGAGPAYIRWAVSEIHAAARESGRSPADIGIAVWIPVYIGGDRNALLLRARRWAAGMLSIPAQGELLLEKAGLDMSILADVRRHYQAYPHSGDVERAAQQVPDEVVTALAVVGTVDFVVRRLEEYLEAGAQTLVVAPGALKKMAPLIPGANGRSSKLPLPT